MPVSAVDRIYQEGRYTMVVHADNVTPTIRCLDTFDEVMAKLRQ